jgi:RNA-binding protein
MITTRQRLYLRKLAQTLPTKFQLGKEALHPDWLKMVDLALGKLELIKLHVLKSTQADADTLIPKLVKSLKAELVQTIGHRVVIYRAHPTEPKIVLPT